MPPVNELEITFRGPFAFDFNNSQQKGTITVYAPNCNQHVSSIQTDEEEWALPGADDGHKRELYELRFAPSNSETGFFNKDKLLLIDRSAVTSFPDDAAKFYWVEEGKNELQTQPGDSRELLAFLRRELVAAPPANSLRPRPLGQAAASRRLPQSCSGHHVSPRWLERLRWMDSIRCAVCLRATSA